MLKLFKKQKIHNGFYLLLLDEDTTIKSWANENIIKQDFEIHKSKEYGLKII